MTDFNTRPISTITTSANNTIYSFVVQSESEYVSTYSQISADHVQSLSAIGSNPFVSNPSYVEQVTQWTNSLITKYRSLLPSHCSFVEVGVGEGLTCLASHADSVTAVDIALPYLDRLPPPLRLVHADAESLPFRENTFQIALYSDIFEHVIDLHKSISEARRIVSPGGYLLIRVPHDELMTPYRTYKNYRYTHLRSFCDDELENLLERVYNLKVVETSFGPAIPSRFSLGAIGRSIPRPAMFDGNIADLESKVYGYNLPFRYKALFRHLNTPYEVKLDYLNTIWNSFGNSNTEERDQLFSLISGPVEKLIVAHLPPA